MKLHVALFQKDMRNLAISRESKARAFVAAATAATAATAANVVTAAAAAAVEDAERPKSSAKVAAKFRGWGLMKNALEEKPPERGASPPTECEGSAKHPAVAVEAHSKTPLLKHGKSGEGVPKLRSPRPSSELSREAILGGPACNSTPAVLSPRQLERTRKATVARTARSAHAGASKCSVWTASAAYTEVNSK